MNNDRLENGELENDPAAHTAGGPSESQDPDEIRHDIERTRARLSRDVDALTDSARPGAIVQRRVTRLRSSLSGARDRVMGSAEHHSASSLGEARRAAARTPDMVREQTQGSPLAVGLAAFAVGWVVGAALPSSPVERRAAGRLGELGEPVAHQVRAAAKDVADTLQEPAKDAARSVGESVTQAAKHTASTATPSR